jgi:membrane protease YdiL (CAAX protease family)
LSTRADRTAFRIVVTVNRPVEQPDPFAAASHVPPVAPPPEAEPAPPLAPAPEVPRFCTRCGAPWQPEWLECRACAARHARDIGDAGGNGGATPAGVAPPVGQPYAPIFSAVWLYLAYLGSSVVLMIAALAGAPEATTDIVVSSLISLVVLAWCVRARRDVFPGLRLPHPKWFAAAVGGSLLTFALASAAVALLSRFAGVPTLDYISPFTRAGYGMWVVVLLIAVQPGIFEELAFRGVILGGLRHAPLSTTEAVIVSAALFMIIHLALPSFPHLLVMGLALGWLRVLSGSLYPGMLLHFLHNLMVLLTEHWRI